MAQPTPSATCREAVKSGSPFDIVLLDLDTPELDGFAVAERIKALDEINEQRLVMATSSKDMITRAQEAGIEVITKPVDPSALLNTLIRMIAASRRRIRAASGMNDALRGLRVLLVEDNDFNQEVAKGSSKRQAWSSMSPATARSHCAWPKPVATTSS